MAPRNQRLHQGNRLLHECRDLDHDPAVWHRHMLASLIQLIGVRCVASGVIRTPAGPNKLSPFVHIAEMAPRSARRLTV
jgi:hypothetical protein